MRECKLIYLPKIEDSRGNLSYIETSNHVPFLIQRAYWIYDVPGGCSRGGHAFKVQKEFIIALSGSFDVLIDDGVGETIFQLNRSYYGLYVPAGLWREMLNFSTNSLALIVSSTNYSDSDYIRDYNEFQNLALYEK